MSILQSAWKIGEKPRKLAESKLANEKILEDMIAEDVSILGESWMLIGRQVVTSFGKYIDLLAIEEGGNLIIIELKKNKTPREVVAQGIDYASWVENLSAEKISDIYRDYTDGGDLSKDFEARYNTQLEEDTLNQSHQVIIVAAKLDPSTERIVNYLSNRDIPINVLFFSVFEDGGTQYLSRTWLLDPTETQGKASTRVSGPSEPWIGEYYVSFGVGEDRNWDDARKYGFICAGGGKWYSQTLSMLSKGDRIWVNIPKVGYVGIGIVQGSPALASEYIVETESGQVPFYDLKLKGHYNRENADDETISEYMVPVKWIASVPINEAISELGFFGNQNSVCKPTTTKWSHTVNRLKERFGI